MYRKKEDQRELSVQGIELHWSLLDTVPETIEELTNSVKDTATPLGNILKMIIP
ncbi:MAG: hypothetical protein LBU99_05280 [Spirochaetaceae bacterium]|jgi:hypothetical protein|nr:hypothetical protein [Spirochaetaceae bacterium]